MDIIDQVYDHYPAVTYYPRITIDDLRQRLYARGVDAEAAAIALHEAGHAIVAMALGRRVVALDIGSRHHAMPTGTVQSRAVDTPSSAVINQQRCLELMGALVAIQHADGIIQHHEARATGSSQRLTGTDAESFEHAHRLGAFGDLSLAEAKHLCQRAATAILAAHRRELVDLTVGILRATNSGQAVSLDTYALAGIVGPLAMRWQSRVPASPATTPARATTPAASTSTTSPVLVKTKRRPEIPLRDVPKRGERTKAGDPRQIEYRAAKAEINGSEGIVAGHLSTFWHVDSYGTAFAPGAWEKSIRERGDKLFLLYQHWPDWAIGKLANVQVDAFGLKHESAIVDDGAEGTVVRKRLAAGIPFGHSVGFRTIYERPAKDDDPLIFTENSPQWARDSRSEVWVIEEAKLYEGSIVTFPANDMAVINDYRDDLSMQALAQSLEDLRAGRLTPPQRALVADLIAAWQAAPESQRGDLPSVA